MLLSFFRDGPPATKMGNVYSEMKFDPSIADPNPPPPHQPPLSPPSPPAAVSECPSNVGSAPPPPDDNSDINPLNMMPPPNQQPSPDQPFTLPTDRQKSTIPRAGKDISYCNL